MLADHDDGERDAGEDEVREREDQRNGPQEWVLPEEPEALRDLCADARNMRFALLLEGRAHREQRADREDVRDQVGDERECAGYAEQRSAERRTCESYGRLTCLQRARGRRHLWGWHDCAHRAGRGDAEERSCGPFDERHSRDEPERQRVCQNRRGEPADSHGLYDVGDDHHALAIPTVRGNACEERRRAQRGGSPRTRRCPPSTGNG